MRANRVAYTAVLSVLIAQGLQAIVHADDVGWSQTAPSTPAQQDAPIFIDDNDPGWTWSGLVSVSDPSYRGGGAHAGGPGTHAVYTFTGAGVAVMGQAAPTVSIDGRLHRMGKAKVSIDGVTKGETSMWKADTLFDARISAVTGLKFGNHVLQIDAESGWIVIDYIKVQKQSDAPPADSGDGSDTSDPVGKGHGRGTGNADGSGAASGTGVSYATEGTFRLIPRNAPASCLELSGSMADGAPATIHKIASGRMQYWRITDVGGGKYAISPANSQYQALTLLPPEMGFAHIGLKTYTGADTQKWTMKPTDGGYCLILQASSPRTKFNVNGGVTNSKDGTTVIGFSSGPPQGDLNEQWLFKPVQ